MRVAGVGGEEEELMVGLCGGRLESKLTFAIENTDGFGLE